MKQEEKKLSLIDFCARLPYGVIVDRLGVPRKVLVINSNNMTLLLDRGEYMSAWYRIEEIKPYLRPMSSMTEEERAEFYKVGGIMSHKVETDTYVLTAFSPDAYDWLNKKMFDYRGLIEKALAIEAPEEMYGKEEQK